eukprot:16276-Eustigmatos_ZCMA.PRE.1
MSLPDSPTPSVGENPHPDQARLCRCDTLLRPERTASGPDPPAPRAGDAAAASWGHQQLRLQESPAAAAA